MNRLTKTTRGAAWRWLARLVRHFGYVLIPTHEIDRLDYEGRCAYAYRDGAQNLSERDSGYFNGLGDCYSKTAYNLRERYLPNAQGQPRAEQT